MIDAIVIGVMLLTAVGSISAMVILIVVSLVTKGGIKDTEW